MIKAVFFDLDETMADSLSSHLKATRLVFEKFGYDYELIRENAKGVDFMGRRISDILLISRDLSNISEKELPINKLIQIREKYLLDLVMDETIICPGVIEMLRKLKELNKVVAIVSSGSKKYIDLVLYKFKLEKFIDFIISGDQVKRGKPDPECYEHAYKYLNINYGQFSKKECLVIEDTENGVIAASKSGLKILLVPSKFSVLPRSIKPDYTLKSLEQFDILTHLF